MAKTDWSLYDIVKPEDMNQLGAEINALTGHVDDYTKHSVMVEAVVDDDALKVSVPGFLPNVVDGAKLIVVMAEDPTGISKLRINDETKLYNIVNPDGSPAAALKLNGFYYMIYNPIASAFTILGDSGSGGITYGTTQPTSGLWLKKI